MPDSAPLPGSARSGPRGRAGRITGAAWTAGRFGKALCWGEDSGAVSASVKLTQPMTAFTLQAWVRLDRMPTGKIPFWTADVCGQLGAGSITIRPPGVLYVGVQLGSQPNHLLGQTKIALGEWTHVALVYDGKARKIGLFVNGAIDTELDVPPGSPAAVNLSDKPFWVRSYGGPDEKLVGAIDEVCLSRRAETFGYRWRHSIYAHLRR